MLSHLFWVSVESALGKVVVAHPHLFADLTHRCIALNLTHPTLVVSITFLPDGCVITQGINEDADLFLGGALPTLLRMLATGGNMRHGSAALIEVKGETIFLPKILRILQQVKEQPETFLQAFLAEPFHHLLFSSPFLFDQIKSAWHYFSSSFKSSTEDYLYYETEVLPNPSEFESFQKGIETLRDDVERLSLRVQRLTMQQTGMQQTEKAKPVNTVSVNTVPVNTSGEPL